MRHPISTFPRFMYLNAYAFLLLLVGIGIMLLPGYRISWWLLLPQAIVALPCFKGASTIFASWKDKKRKYDLLMQPLAATVHQAIAQELPAAQTHRVREPQYLILKLFLI